MATSNSSTNDDEFELTSPGQRTGEGSGSVIPYLHESLATRPGALVPADHHEQPNPARSLARRVRRALLAIGKKKKKK
jgi:hypothetical protein